MNNQTAQEYSSNSLLRISNALNLTRQEFNASEKHILLVTLLHLKKYQSFDPDLESDGRSLEITFNTKELKETNKVRIREALDRITSRKIHFDLSANGKEHYRWVVPFIFAEYKAENRVQSTITIKLNPDCKKLFLDLAKGYTPIDIKAALELKGIHSIRMYELLSMKLNNGEWIVDLDKLKTYLSIDESKYRTYTMFEERVLKSTQKEIAASCGLFFDWEIFEKERKKITKLKFTVRSTEQMNKIVLQEETAKTIDYIVNLSDIELANKVRAACQIYNFADKQIQWILESKERISELIRLDLIIQDKIAAGKAPKDITRYMAKSLGLDKIKFK